MIPGSKALAYFARTLLGKGVVAHISPIFAARWHHCATKLSTPTPSITILRITALSMPIYSITQQQQYLTLNKNTQYSLTQDVVW
jgi:hypothetical protein